MREHQNLDYQIISGIIKKRFRISSSFHFLLLTAAPPPPLPKEPPPPLPKPVYRDGIELQIDKEPSILPTFEKKVELFSKVPPPSAVTLVRRPPPSVISEKVRPVFSKVVNFFIADSL